MRIFKKINIDQGTFRGFKDVPKKMEPEDWKIFCKLIKFYQNYLDIKYFSVIEKIKAKEGKKSSEKRKIDEKYNIDVKIRDWFKILLFKIRDKFEYTCSRCGKKDKNLIMFCTNIDKIRELRIVDFIGVCENCFKILNNPPMRNTISGGRLD